MKKKRSERERAKETKETAKLLISNHLREHILKIKYNKEREREVRNVFLQISFTDYLITGTKKKYTK
jgi:hypothetical protein